MAQSKHLIALVTVVAIMTWAWGRGKTAQMQTEALKPRSSHAAPAWGAVTSWSIGPGHKAQLSSQRTTCHFPKGSHRPWYPSPSWPSMPPSHHHRLISHGKLDSDILGMSLWPTLNCKGWELQTSVLSANEPSIHCSRKDRETTGLWQTPSLPDPPESLSHPLHFPLF